MRRLASALLLTGLFAACADPARPTAQLDEGQRRQLYERADGVIEEGVLLSPAAGSADIDLAPLLIREIGTAGPLTVVPTVYVHVGSVELDGRTLEQRTYLWERGEREAQGIRVTMDSDGFPSIYEVLDDSSGARLLFVSRLLDDAAIEAYGDPLAGRRFSIEREIDDASDVVVAGLLEPGSMPLGPFVYLTAGGDVAAVICRCMESRVGSIVDSRQYELTAIEGLERLPFELPAWLEDGTSPVTELRLPAGTP